MNRRLRALPLVLGILCCLSNSAAFSQVEETSRKAGLHVLKVFKTVRSDESAEFCVFPPDKSDLNVDLSAAAAFTTQTSGISGIAICSGKRINSAVNTHLAGTAIFMNGNFEIFANEHGNVLTPLFIGDVQKAGGSLFQQFLLVKDSKAQAFKDAATAARRALVVFDTGERALVQSSNQTTLGQFAHDLQSIGVRNAVYTPVGDADGGWYRNGEKIVSIGASSAPIPVQSNWVIWKRSNSRHDPAAVDVWLSKHKR